MIRPDGLDPLHGRQPDPDPLTPTDVGDGYDDGFVAGVAHGIAHERKRDQLAAVALAGAIAALLLVAFVVGRASAAPRSGQTTERFDVSPPSSAALSGAPRNGPPVSRLADRTPTVDVDGRGAPSSSGLVAYAATSFGPRYLALPGGPGIRVRICINVHQAGPDRCIDRTSTDAGPALSMQRAGRIADVSFVDFAWLCRCDPPDVGLLVASIEYSAAPALTAPPTDVTP